MIDHVSIPVSDLARSGAFYDRVLGNLGLARMVERGGTIGYGKRYPEFWLNLRETIPPVVDDCGMHVCLRAPGIDAVEAFFASAIDYGGTGDGDPGLRPDYGPTYYAAFVRDPDGNRIEAVTFVDLSSG
jgi:catechol 2,3-dioxygenase-like lactoylglutathione lyase family enzyme